MPVTKQAETLVGHIENKEWDQALALVQKIVNIQTLLKSGWERVWNDADVPPSLVRLLLMRIKVLSHYKNTLYPIGLYPYMFQEKLRELLRNASVSTVKAFFGALTGTYRAGLTVQWPQRDSLKDEIDALWNGYLGLPWYYTGQTRAQGDPEKTQQVLSVQSMEDLERLPELQALWQKTELLIKAALGLDLDIDDWLVLHAIAELDCLSIVMWFALKLYPDQVHTRNEHGNTPLHIAVTKPIYAQPVYAITETRYNHFRTSYPVEFQEAQEFMAAFLVSARPECATYMDSTKRVPLLTSILSLQRQLHHPPPSQNDVLSHPQLDHRLNKLIGAAPEALASRDFSTRLYPFQLAATVDAPLDCIYTLLRGDPSALKYRRITKREADYERLLKENNVLKQELQEKDSLIQELHSKLEQYEKQSEEEKQKGKRKRPRRAS